MLGQTQLIFLLAIITLVHGNVVSPKNEATSYKLQAFSRAKLDKTIDFLLPSIRTFILENGMDPMKLIDFSESIFPRLPGKMKGNIDFKKGWMQNLSKLERTGIITAEYSDMLLTLNMNFGFKVLDCNYEYFLRYFLYKRQGSVYGRFYDLNINTILTIDFANHYLDVKSIKFSKIRKYDIKFEGHILDNILNCVIKLVTRVFQRDVLRVIEERSITIFNAKLDEWNRTFPRPNRTEMIEKWLNLPDV